MSEATPITETPTAPAAPPPLLGYQQGSLKAVPDGWTGVEVFGLPLERQGKAVWSMVWRQVILKLPMVVVYVVMLHFLMPESPRLILTAAATLAGVMTLSSVFGHWRLKKRLARQWPTFRLIVADQGLMRTCMDFPDLRILREEITSVREYSRGLLVRSNIRVNFLLVPSYIENYPRMREMVAGLRAIDSRRPRLLVARNMALIILIMIAFMGVVTLGLWSQNLWLELLSLVVVSAGVAWNIRTMFKSPNVAAGQKYGSLMLITLPMWMAVRIGMELFPQWFRW